MVRETILDPAVTWPWTTDDKRIADQGVIGNAQAASAEFGTAAARAGDGKGRRRSPAASRARRDAHDGRSSRHPAGRAKGRQLRTIRYRSIADDCRCLPGSAGRSPFSSSGSPFGCSSMATGRCFPIRSRCGRLGVSLAQHFGPPDGLSAHPVARPNLCRPDAEARAAASPSTAFCSMWRRCSVWSRPLRPIAPGAASFSVMPVSRPLAFAR